jgi:hypothetical protein
MSVVRSPQPPQAGARAGDARAVRSGWSRGPAAQLPGHYQRPIGRRGRIVGVQGVLPTLEAGRLDGGRPALPIHIDDHRVGEVVCADALTEPLQ